MLLYRRLPCKTFRSWAVQDGQDLEIITILSGQTKLNIIHALKSCEESKFFYILFCFCIYFSIPCMFFHFFPFPHMLFPFFFSKLSSLFFYFLFLCFFFQNYFYQFYFFTIKLVDNLTL